jgi:hypothetical protein
MNLLTKICKKSLREHDIPDNCNCQHQAQKKMPKAKSPDFALCKFPSGMRFSGWPIACLPGASCLESVERE